MLLLHVTKIIDLERAGGGPGYNCFYGMQSLVVHAPKSMLWCQESLSSSQAFRPSASRWSVLACLLCASAIALPL